MLVFAKERELGAGDRQFLSTAAAMAAQALVRAELLDVERRSVRALQRSLLPSSLPRVPGLEVVARYAASDHNAQVGGDWYDVVPLAGGAVALVLGDVEGHDLEAAALMGLVRSAVRAYALEGHPPAVLMARANTFLAGLSLNRIVTLSYSQLHPSELLVTSVSAGHLPTLVLAPDGCVTEVPSEIGPPLGVHDDGQHWPETTSTLPEGSVLVTFSDGLVEVRGQDIAQGLDRVRAALRAEPGRAPDQVADALLAVRGESHDDVALLVARLTAHLKDEGRRVTRRLPATAGSVTLARRFTEQLLTAWQVPAGVIGDAQLVVSELVTNAARDSQDDVVLSLAVTGRVLRVEVSDTSHRMPEQRLAADDATSGRGLALVAAVSRRWGVESEGLAKLVWAELDLGDPDVRLGDPRVQLGPPLVEPVGTGLRADRHVGGRDEPPAEHQRAVQRQRAPDVGHAVQVLQPGVADEHDVGVRRRRERREHPARAGRQQVGAGARPGPPGPPARAAAATPAPARAAPG